MMKKLLVLSLVLAIGAVSSALPQLSYDNGVLSVSGLMPADPWLFVNTNGTIGNFAAGPDAPTDGLVDSYGPLSDWVDDAGPFPYANGDVWGLASAASGYYPRTGLWLTADLTLDGFVQSSIQVTEGAIYEEIRDVTAAGYWVDIFKDVLTENFEQGGANVVLIYWDEINDPILADEKAFLGDMMFVGSSTETVFVDSVYVIPEPMTMGLLGLGALFLRRRK